jgi:FG-GAP-like repeat
MVSLSVAQPSDSDVETGVVIWEFARSVSIYDCLCLIPCFPGIAVLSRETFDTPSSNSVLRFGLSDMNGDGNLGKSGIGLSSSELHRSSSPSHSQFTDCFGLSDILRFGTNTGDVLLGSGQSDFDRNSLWTNWTGSTPVWLAADVNGDGVTDVIEYVSSTIYVHTQSPSGDGSFTSTRTLFTDSQSTPVSGFSMSAVDWTADGCLDLVVSSSNFGHRIFAGSCTANSMSLSSTPLTTITNCKGPSVAFDANQDG